MIWQKKKKKLFLPSIWQVYEVILQAMCFYSSQYLVGKDVIQL